ncbi:MAG TPA: M12 family metallo-peptidase [Phycisphaerae bacterium]|jgi:hypothetical protein
MVRRSARAGACGGLALAVVLVAASNPSHANEGSRRLRAAELAQSKSDILARLKLRGGELADIDPGAAALGPREITVPLGGRNVVLDVEPYSLRAENFRLLAQVNGSLIDVAPEPPATYRGFVQGEPDSSVAVSIRNGNVTGTIDVPSAGITYAIQPITDQIPEADKSVHVVYRFDDPLDRRGTCGVDPAFLQMNPPPADTDIPEGSGVYTTCQVAFDADFEFYQQNGSSIPNTTADIENVFNSVDAQYDRDVDIRHVITTIIVQTNVSDPYTSFEASTLLSQFQNYWNANHANVVRDTAHLMTGRTLNGTVLGVSYLGTICFLGSSYGLSASHFTTTFSRRVDLTTHEIGHAWNAPHCENAGTGFCTGCCTSPTYTMCSFLDFSVRNEFCQGSKDVINAFRATRTCLSPPAPEITALPLVDNFNSTTLDDTTKWMPFSGATVDGVGLNEPSGGLSLRLNSSGALAGGDQLRSRTIDTSAACSVNITYSYERKGGGNQPEPGDDLFVEYLDPTYNWQLASQQFGSGPAMTAYQPVTVTLPNSARHPRFRVRLRNIAGGPGDEDDWFVDDFSVFDSGGSVAFDQQPQSQTICLNGIATFSASVSGTGPFNYQWRKDGVDIPGATQSSYTIDPVAAGSAGSYTLFISNACVSVSSDPAVLTVDTAHLAPSIVTQPVSQTTCAGAPVTLSVAASGDPPLSYQWYIDFSILPGATSANYMISSAQSSDMGAYTVDVTNNCGTRTSDAAQLTINVCPVSIVSANPPRPNANPYQPGQPFRDCLDTGTGGTLSAGIGGAGTAPQGGISYSPISVTFSAPPIPAPTPQNTTISCTGGLCPSVTGVSGSGVGPYLITLSAPIPPLHCTSLVFAATGPSQKLQYQSSPGDVDLDGAASTLDLLWLVQRLNDGTANLPANAARYNVDRTGSVNTADLLREVQLLNGINTTQPFNGASVTLCPP